LLQLGGMRYRTPTPQILRPFRTPWESIQHFGFSLTTRRLWFTALSCWKGLTVAVSC